MNRPVTVIGATGKTGRRILARLDDAGIPRRALGRATSPAFDWNEPEGWPDALAGAGALYVAYVPDLAVAHAASDIARLLEIARDAGVPRVVLLSGRGEAGARHCEELVLASGIPATIVRASWFAQNFTEGMLADAATTGVLALAAGEAREPFVDIADIADVAVAALTGTGHSGRVYEVTGPELLSFADAAEAITRASGRPVAYVPLGFTEFREAVASHAGDEVAEMLTELCREVFDGRNESLATGVRDALGREPRSLADVLAAELPTGVRL
jgi:uncharacterized protein YbjT (DUF2867 family)